ncbi:MAG: XapX domain-containing protein [Thermodesulfobacteriota bacterium]
MLEGIIKALLVGLATGAIFSLFKLPIPAPSALAGIIGIIGIYLGFVIVKYLYG